MTRSHRFLAFAFALAWLLPASVGASPAGPWSTQSAYTLPARRLEVGLLQSTHYGVTESFELSTPTLGVWLLPALEGKATVLEQRSGALGVRGRLSYPTPFLKLVSRSGAGGLLPETSRPPQALGIDVDFLATARWREAVLVSAWFGVGVAPHAVYEPEALPLLDFPFLYPRLAPLYTPVVPRSGVVLEGCLLAKLHYTGELLLFLLPGLPDVSAAFALEHGQSAEWRFNDKLALSLGVRSSYARYPHGLRGHYLPYADLRIGL